MMQATCEGLWAALRFDVSFGTFPAMVLTLPLLGCVLRNLAQGLSRAILGALGVNLLLRLTRP